MVIRRLLSPFRVNDDRAAVQWPTRAPTSDRDASMHLILAWLAAIQRESEKAMVAK